MTQASILILAKNEAANIGPCLEAVFSQKGGTPFEVVLVDSGSEDGTVEIARKFPVFIQQIPAGSFHHARTRNHAARLATGNFLVYLAADALPASGTWLESLLAPFDDPLVAAVYGRHLPRAGATRERSATLATIYGERPLVKDRSRKRELGHRCYHFSTVNAALRRAVWEQVKFPEVKVFEDVALSKRLIEAGWKIAYEPRAAVFHSHNHSPDNLLKRYFDIGVTWRRLGIWDRDFRASLVRDAWRLVLGGKVGGRSGGKRAREPGQLQRTAAKFAGVALGLNERLLPLRVKKRLSAFQLFD
jgi:glycosyltransferase involved in cell wall biosynthesis